MMVPAMKNFSLALALTLAVLPVAALAQDATPQPAPPARPVLSPAQRQAMQKTIQEIRTKEVDLHRQYRAQVLNALTPEHRAAVAQAIGDMAISETPDAAATAKRIDGILTPDERQKVLAAQSQFVQQSRAAMQQMHDQMQAVMPQHPAGWTHPGTSNGHPGMPPEPARVAGRWQMPSDAGSILLAVLSHGGAMGMMHFGSPTSAARPLPPPEGAPPRR